MGLRQDSDRIISATLGAVQPNRAVAEALKAKNFDSGRVITVAVGKAAWSMAAAAKGILGRVMDAGVVITKYGHSQGDIPGLKIYEGGHPVPDDNTYAATAAALELTGALAPDDTVLFLLSGGGSALFELPLIDKGELESVTRQLLKSGADIVEMNTLRKRFSSVKGGRFAQHCAPAKVFAIVLSDIIGDPLDMIASGPAYPDSSTCAQAQAVWEKYKLDLSPDARRLLLTETPKTLDNVETVVTGSVAQLCAAAAKEAAALGYSPVILTDSLTCEAREAGRFLAAIARYNRHTSRPLAFIAGGETVVRVTGTGLGGRNQELALAAGEGIAGMDNAAVFSLGSDGTDGPTDAAGGYVDGGTLERLAHHGLSIFHVLEDNDAYHALEKTGGLIMTGATGTNVNDVSVLLITPASR